MKKYTLVTDAQRAMLIHMVYQKVQNVAEAARNLNIYYPTAKAINKVYLNENRVLKKSANNKRMTGVGSGIDERNKRKPQKQKM